MNPDRQRESYLQDAQDSRTSNLEIISATFTKFSLVNLCGFEKKNWLERYATMICTPQYKRIEQVFDIHKPIANGRSLQLDKGLALSNTLRESNDGYLEVVIREWAVVDTLHEQLWQHRDIDSRIGFSGEEKCAVLVFGLDSKMDEIITRRKIFCCRADQFMLLL